MYGNVKKVSKVTDVQK